MRRPGTAVGLGAASWLAGIVLTGAAAWLLVRAATLPPVLTLSTAVVLVRGSAVARPLLRYLERLVSHDVAFAELGARRARVYAGLIPRVPGPRLHRRGDLLSRVVGDVDADVDGLLRGRLPALGAGLALLVGVAAAVLVLPAAAAALAAGLVIAGVVAPAVAAWHAARWDATTGAARAALRDAVVETVDGVEELAGSGAAGLDVPDRRSRTLAGLETRAARAAGLAAALGHLGWGVAVVGTALAVLGGGSGLSPEWAAVLLLGVVALAEPVAALPDAALARHRAIGARRRLAEVAPGPPSAAASPPRLSDPGSAAQADAPPRPTGPAADVAFGPSTATEAGAPPPTQYTTNTPPPAPTTTEAGAEQRPAKPSPTDTAPGAARQPETARTPWETGLSGGVVVRGLVAGWDPRRPPALDGLDLDLPAGSRVAVRGRSGSGKSTLAAVLARLLDPRSGTVTVGGRDLLALPDAVVRRHVVLVGDDTGHVFASTVRENLRLARPSAPDADLVAALRRVGLRDWLARLPEGLGTWLGTGGSTMSGGERRRLATARALLADPAVLILDEPTEGIDEAGAEALMADLLGAADGRTVLVLTHRVEGLDRVDRIYDLSSCPVVAST